MKRKRRHIKYRPINQKMSLEIQNTYLLPEMKENVERDTNTYLEKI